MITLMDVPEHLRKYVTTRLAQWLGRDVGPRAKVPVLLLVGLCDSAVAASFVVSLLPDGAQILDRAQRHLEAAVGERTAKEAIRRVYEKLENKPLMYFDRLLIHSLETAVEAIYGNNRTPQED